MVAVHCKKIMKNFLHLVIKLYPHMELLTSSKSLELFQCVRYFCQGTKSIITEYFTVFGWIKGRGAWYAFVVSRIGEKSLPRKISNKMAWEHERKSCVTGCQGTNQGHGECDSGILSTRLACLSSLARLIGRVKHKKSCNQFQLQNCNFLGPNVAHALHLLTKALQFGIGKLCKLWERQSAFFPRPFAPCLKKSSRVPTYLDSNIFLMVKIIVASVHKKRDNEFKIKLEMEPIFFLSLSA